MLPFSLSLVAEIVLLTVTSALALASSLLMPLLPSRIAKYLPFFTVPIYLCLIFALFSVGATMDILALVFLALLFVYVGAYTLRYQSRLHKAQKEEEK